ncbi:MAG: LacI family transcriptional regulator [Verrucomicrobia bacterium]|nr:LacI family transcriptional regulator [Verrucomicrobiota bacterium]
MIERRKKPTIKDVAREAGVSIATVSNVLKGKTTEVSEPTVEKILKKVSELGYVKNMTASALASRESRVVAVVVIGAFDPGMPLEHQDLNPFFGDFLFRLEYEARRRGYTLMLYAGREEKYLNFLLERSADAAVLVGINPQDMPSVVARSDLRLILFDSMLDDRNQMNVRTNEIRGGEIAAEYLISTGCKKLGFVGHVSMGGKSVPYLRYSGAKKICDESGISIKEFNRVTAFQQGMEVAAEILENGIDGVVTAADTIAAGLVDGLRDQGIDVPGQVSVIGYDNLPLARLVKPSLTTIDQGLTDKVGAVMDLVENGSPGDLREIEPRLVIRESTR